MCSKKMFSMMMAAVMTVGVSAGTVSAETDYEPVTITLNLQRSGLGENVEYTFTEKPSAVVASGEQMADLFFDLGLEDQMAAGILYLQIKALIKTSARKMVLQCISRMYVQIRPPLKIFIKITKLLERFFRQRMWQQKKYRL